LALAKKNAGHAGRHGDAFLPGGLPRRPLFFSGEAISSALGIFGARISRFRAHPVFPFPNFHKPS
jgi:hypothetical protein